MRPVSPRRTRRSRQTKFGHHARAGRGRRRHRDVGRRGPRWPRTRGGGRGCSRSAKRRPKPGQLAAASASLSRFSWSTTRGACSRSSSRSPGAARGGAIVAASRAARSSSARSWPSPERASALLVEAGEALEPLGEREAAVYAYREALQRTPLDAGIYARARAILVADAANTDETEARGRAKAALLELYDHRLLHVEELAERVTVLLERAELCAGEADRAAAERDLRTAQELAPDEPRVIAALFAPVRRGQRPARERHARSPGTSRGSPSSPRCGGICCCSPPTSSSARVADPDSGRRGARGGCGRDRCRRAHALRVRSARCCASGVVLAARDRRAAQPHPARACCRRGRARRAGDRRHLPDVGFADAGAAREAAVRHAAGLDPLLGRRGGAPPRARRRARARCEPRSTCSRRLPATPRARCSPTRIGARVAGLAHLRARSRACRETRSLDEHRAAARCARRWPGSGDATGAVAAGSPDGRAGQGAVPARAARLGRARAAPRRRRDRHAPAPDRRRALRQARSRVVEAARRGAARVRSAWRASSARPTSRSSWARAARSRAITSASSSGADASSPMCSASRAGAAAWRARWRCSRIASAVLERVDDAALLAFFGGFDLAVAKVPWPAALASLKPAAAVVDERARRIDKAIPRRERKALLARAPRLGELPDPRRFRAAALGAAARAPRCSSPVISRARRASSARKPRRSSVASPCRRRSSRRGVAGSRGRWPDGRSEEARRAGRGLGERARRVGRAAGRRARLGRREPDLADHGRGGRAGCRGAAVVRSRRRDDRDGAACAAAVDDRSARGSIRRGWK